MKRAQRMCKTRVLRALVGIESETELLNASQSLKFGRVDQTHHQLAFVGIGAKANDVVDRIAIDSFRHWQVVNTRKKVERQSHGYKKTALEEITKTRCECKNPACDFWTFPFFCFPGAFLDALVAHSAGALVNSNFDGVDLMLA